MSVKINLTDRFIKSRKAPPAGRRDEYCDALVPGLALRVTERGHKSFALAARYPLHTKHTTRRALGEYGAITLGDARRKAREWLELIRRGIDPKIEQERSRGEQMRSQANSFASVADDFLKRHAAKLAKFKDVKATLDNEFTARWGARPIADVTPQDVATAIKAIVARGARYQAHNAFGYLRRMFNWSIGTQEFGLIGSPLERLRPGDLIGKREARDRVLRDPELRIAWEAAGELGYPYGPLVRLLILTGQRVSEVSDMTWPEVDFDNRLWTIPAARMKGGRAHEVPVNCDAAALLRSVPRPTTKKGEYIFSTVAGASPVNGFSKAKTRLDREVARIIAARAEKAGEQPQPIPHFVFHDLRRTMRTHLSALPVQDLVRELIIAHAKPGLHKVYDQHTYRDEKRQALELWEKRLAGIVNPAPAGVADLAKARARRRAARSK